MAGKSDDVGHPSNVTGSTELISDALKINISTNCQVNTRFNSKQYNISIALNVFKNNLFNL